MKRRIKRSPTHHLGLCHPSCKRYIIIIIVSSSSSGTPSWKRCCHLHHHCRHHHRHCHCHGHHLHRDRDHYLGFCPVDCETILEDVVMVSSSKHWKSKSPFHLDWFSFSSLWQCSQFFRQAHFCIFAFSNHPILLPRVLLLIMIRVKASFLPGSSQQEKETAVSHR